MSFEQVDLEEVRKYWNDRPCNLRHSTARVGSMTYFEQVEARKYMVEPHIPGFAQFERWKGKQVLEIGCGLGTDTVNFARAGANVTAVDLSRTSLQLAEKRVRLEGLQDRVWFQEGNAEDLSYLSSIRPGSFDLVYSFGVIHHTPHPDRAFRTVYDYLKPGGEFRVMVYNRHSWKAAEITKGRIWDSAAIARESEAQTGCPVTYTYTKKELSDALARAGMAMTEARVEHIFPYVVDEYVKYNYVKRPVFKHMPASMFGWLEHRLGWHLCAVATKVN